MKSLRFTLRATVGTRGEVSSHLQHAGDGVLVVRGDPRWLFVRCPCGCGADIPINLDPRAGSAWRVYNDKRTGLSLYPSVWRDTDCGSHFIIWRNRIFLFGAYPDAFASTDDEEIVALLPHVLSAIPLSGMVPYVQIAEVLRAVPWDVLDACRRLVRSGQLREGLDKDRGMFGRRT